MGHPAAGHAVIRCDVATLGKFEGCRLVVLPIQLLVRVAAMMTGVLVFLGRLVDDRGLGGPELQPCAPCSLSGFQGHGRNYLTRAAVTGVP